MSSRQCLQLVHCLNDIMLVSSGDCLVSNSPVLDNMKTGRRFNRKRDNDFESTTKLEILCREGRWRKFLHSIVAISSVHGGAVIKWVEHKWTKTNKIGSKSVINNIRTPCKC